MLTIYVPSNKLDSKCWQVFNPLLNEGWPDTEVMYEYIKQDTPGMFWGFVGGNMQMIKRYEEDGDHDWYFADMPYFGRWNGNDDQKVYWRIIKNALHMTPSRKCYDDDRWKAHNIDLYDWNDKGEHILVCPSSITMTRYYYNYDDSIWVDSVISELKKHTDRPIRVRNKPRGKGTSGPSVALVPFADDLKDAHAVVTSVSMAAVEAAVLGIPGFCHPSNAASMVNLTNLSQIEKPIYPNRKKWLNNLCYNQFTPEEMQDGLAYKILC